MHLTKRPPYSITSSARSRIDFRDRQPELPGSFVGCSMGRSMVDRAGGLLDQRDRQIA
jgi:hypothetical protein